MGKQFRSCDLNQACLLPPSLQDGLPEGHLVRFVAEVVEALDLSAICGRVGERAIPQSGTTHSPLVEPDKQISRHPARLETYGRRLAQAVEGGQPLQTHPPHALELRVMADAFRRAEGPLAASPQMLRGASENVRVEGTEGVPGIPEIEVVPPALIRG